MGEGDNAREGARTRDFAWLGESMTWFAAGVIGMLIVFVGLAVDAYRHNNGAGEESLLSFGNPGHAIAAIGLAVTSAAMLAGLSVAALKGVDTANLAIRRFIPVTAAWVAVATVAISSVTYIGASGVTVGHSHDDGNGDTVAAAEDDHHDGQDGGDAGVAQALEEEGISGTDTDPDTVQGALTQGASGHPDGRHDHGKHATFTELTSKSDEELVSLFPENTVTEEDLPSLRSQVIQVREVALKFPTTASANAGGYVNTTSDVPFMGQHYLNFDYVRDGIFDPAKPEGLLYSKIDGGEPKLVGVWFLQIPGIGGVKKDVEPVGFAGDLDLWHAHVGLCLVGLSGASEGETKEGCEAKGGRFTADLRWMMHVWVAPEASENPDGFFAYLNGDLYNKQQAAKQAGGEAAPSGVTP
jgi:hypothetical protein